MGVARDIGLLQRAEEFLDLAVDERHRDVLRRNACFHNAFTAAELAGKCLLVKATGDHARDHNIAGSLAYHGLIPRNVDERALSDLFRRTSSRATT